MQSYLFLVSQFLKIKAHFGPLISKVDIANNHFLWYCRNQQAFINLNKIIINLYLGVLLVKHLSAKNKHILFVSNRVEHLFFKMFFKNKNHSFFYGNWVPGIGTSTIKKIPDFVFILGNDKSSNLVQECSSSNIPVFSILGLEQKNSQNPYIIPGNINNFLFIWFLIYLFYLESFLF